MWAAANRSPVAPLTDFGDISVTSPAASMSCMDDSLLLGMSDRAISPELGSVGSALSKSALYSLLSSNSCEYDAVLTSCATTDGGLEFGFFPAESMTCWTTPSTRSWIIVFCSDSASTLWIASSTRLCT